MTPFIHSYTVDIRSGMRCERAKQPVGHGDALADCFVVTMVDGHEAIDLAGVGVSALVIRPDGATVTLKGEVKDGSARVTLDDMCYDIPGNITVTVLLMSGEIKQSVLRVGMNVTTGETDIIAETEVLNVADVLAAAERAEAAAERAEAAGGGGTGVVVPDYWLAHLQKRVPTIRAAMTAAGWDKSAFLWYHDVHWTYGYKKAPMLLKYLYQHTPINKTVFGGDIVDNEGDDATMAYLWDWREAVRGLPNHHSVPGNHDDGNSTDNLWDDPYIYAYLLAAEETLDVVRGDAGLYYYIDDPTEKTRYLYLDTATKDGNIIYDTAQQEWLKSTLKHTPSGWHIVAIAHIWRSVDYDVTPPADAGWSYGGAYCIEQFDAYNARTGEYANCTGTGRVEFCIGGHTHVDADFVSDGGIPVILTECDARYVRSGLACTAGTITESSVNAIVADYTHGHVRVVRIGRGVGRTVMLDGSGSIEDEDDETGEDTPVVPDVPTGDFTNVLTEVGYSENTRFSSSSLSDTASTGWDITGYIPATRNDVIRMANVDFIDLDGGGGATSRAMIYSFDADKTYITCSDGYSADNKMSDAWSPVYDADGDTIQFTIPSSYSSTVAYIRIGARDISQYSVITVNEPIE